MLITALLFCFSGAAQEEDSTKVRTNGDLFITSGVTMMGTGTFVWFASRRIAYGMIGTGAVLTGVGLVMNLKK